MNSIHPGYAFARVEWDRVRDCLAGEIAVKAKAETYLPRLDSQTDEEYRLYIQRAGFFGGTARVLEDCLAAAFKRSPELSLGSPGDQATGLKAFLEDCDRAGTSFADLAKWVLSEVLAVGRAGTLVVAEEEGRPVLSTWKAEQILDWKFNRTKGFLEKVVLNDENSIVKYWLHRGHCVREVWTDGSLKERHYLRRQQSPLTLVPFVLHGPRNSGGSLQRAPLADVAACNLDHYRLSADYRQGLHLAALPTAWVSGFDKTSALRVGASEAWVSEIPGATAGFLEFKGTGLAHVEKALQESERQMKELGDRLLGRNEGGPNGEAGLAPCLAAVEKSLSRVLALASAWITGQWSVPTDLRFKFAEVNSAPIKGGDLSALVEAWKHGAISRESLLECLKKGDVLPDGRTVKDEKALLHRR